MPKLYLTLFEIGKTRPQPDGLMAEMDEKPTLLDCDGEEDHGETLTRLDLAVTMLESLGYEVSFTSEPHTEQPSNGYVSVDGR